ncbi:MAG: tetratricopeptide repeat protein [Flavobacteriales bacterium]
MIRALFLPLLPAFALTAEAMSNAQADSIAGRAQQAYAEGDYSAALDGFQAIAGHFQSASLCLALGNTHYKLGNLAQAILWFERGIRLAPADEDLRANLDIANEQVRDRLPSGQDLALGRTWDMLRGNDPDAWARRSLWACLLLFAALAAARAARGLARQSAWVLAGVMAIGLAGCLLMAYARHRAMTAANEAIVMVAKVEARAEPREQAKALFVLHRGTKVSAAETIDGWVEVELPNGVAGWLPAAALERI